MAATKLGRRTMVGLMRTKERWRLPVVLVGTAAAFAVAAALGVAVVTGSDQVRSGAAKAPAVAAAGASSAEGGAGRAEGIRVHGHWTIVVREPDGTLVSRREFENALQGAHVLAHFLARIRSVGRWAVGIAGRLGQTPCAANLRSCFITEGDATFAGSGIFKTLVVTEPALIGAGDFKLVLAGTAEASAAAEIIGVSTSVGGCAPSVAPAGCLEVQFLPSNFVSFTGTSLPAPVPVQPNQQIAVRVVISFS